MREEPKRVAADTKIIGLVGFEPTASWSRTRRSTKLSHSPNQIAIGELHHYFAHFEITGKSL